MFFGAKYCVLLSNIDYQYIGWSFASIEREKGNALKK